MSVAVRVVMLNLCSLCLSGAGGECHVPDCALYLRSAPDLPLTDVVTIVSDDVAMAVLEAMEAST